MLEPDPDTVRIRTCFRSGLPDSGFTSTPVSVPDFRNPVLTMVRSGFRISASYTI